MVDEIFFTVSHSYICIHPHKDTFISAVKVEARMLEFFPFLLFQYLLVLRIIMFQKFKHIL